MIQFDLRIVFRWVVQPPTSQDLDLNFAENHSDYRPGLVLRGSPQKLGHMVNNHDDRGCPQSCGTPFQMAYSR